MKIKLKLITILVFYQYVAFGQSLPVKGKVSGKDGKPIPGVSVKMKNLTVGTTTDVNGVYSINATKGSTIVFSSIGFISKELPVIDNTLNVVLDDDSKGLDDVVVIGYGTKKKRDLTGTVATIDNAEIVKSRATNAQEALQGRMSGVDVRKTSGKPGADMSIEIRGANSITGNTQPLYVVDGIPTGNINDINPADIERIDVLKDASSTAIFGSRGANGVVIVSTKRGSRGTTRINYDAYVGVVNGYHLPEMMNGEQFVAYAREFYDTKARLNATAANPYTPVPDNQIFSPTEIANIATGNYTDWIKLIKRNGLQTNHNLNIAGGDDKTSYFLSAGYQLYQGTQMVENLKKYTLKVGMDRNFGGVFKAGASIYSAFTDNNPSSLEAFRSAYRLRPTGSAYNTDGSNRFFTYETESQITNPLFDYDNEIRKIQNVRLFPNVFAELTPVKGLKIRSSFTPDITFQRYGAYFDTFTKIRAGNRAAQGQNGAKHYFNYTLDNIISYEKELGRHKFDATFGQSLNYYQYDDNLIDVQGLPYRSLWYNVGTATTVTVNGTTLQPVTAVSSSYNKQTLASFFARFNYTLDNKYLFTLTGRRDGNSILNEDRKYGFFPSAAIAWIISNEKFIKDISFIDFLKLRVSYGRSGNANRSFYLGPYVTQSTIGSTQYDFNGVIANGFAPTALIDKGLTWETTNEYNGGIELTMLKSRLSLQVDYYHKTSKGSILLQQIPAANGFSTVVTNLGSVLNKGVEVNLNSTNVKSGDFSWVSSVNFSANHNEILDLYGDGKNDVGNSRFIGEKSRVIYNYKVLGVWQNDEAAQAALYGQIPGQYKIEDVNGDKKITTDDRQVLGSDIPNWFGGITNTFTYKNLDLGFTLYTRQGVTQASAFTGAFVNDDQGRARFNVLNRAYWTPTNNANYWANPALETDGNRKTARTFMDASYTKISNITMGYTFSKRLTSKLKVSSLRLYATAVNPFIWTDFIGWDPETADLSTFELQNFRTRTFLFGLNISL
ncbi:TonB-dependent receptor [Pedobacter frigidisoli]|uniref:SusC/RagA family TonB-linked outer membrane protein n=1 Tax=Pedobacter frigidisoli TaxID=2530455 RepID=UPI00292DA74D|nr:TonB-dependent receptor [Pedobacter frigidisoli]